MQFNLYQGGQDAALKQLFKQTFTASEGEAEGAALEAFVEAMLTSCNDNELQVYVAMDNEQIIGAVMFSSLRVNNGPSSKILSPMAIAPEYQGQGLGQALISVGLSDLKAQGVKLVMTYGDPAFYGKVGFKAVSEAQVKAPFTLSFPHGWIGQMLDGSEIPHIEGSIGCVAALNKPEMW